MNVIIYLQVYYPGYLGTSNLTFMFVQAQNRTGEMIVQFA
jgi:hypothetical protein